MRAVRGGAGGAGGAGAIPATVPDRNARSYSSPARKKVRASIRIGYNRIR